MILGHGPTLHINRGHTMLRPIAMNAAADSLDEAERALILQLVKRCNWRICESNGAVALLDFKPTTIESRIKKLVPSR
jgi:formate hydrogenlyase transcriptional activator